MIGYKLNRVQSRRTTRLRLCGAPAGDPCHWVISLESTNTSAASAQMIVKAPLRFSAIETLSNLDPEE